MLFRSMGVINPISPPQGVPYNSTPYMSYIQQGGYDYASLSLANGSAFGLTSVWLADLTSPSSSQISMSFVGFLPGGSAVTNTFVTPGNGATTLATYLFSPSFAFGLARVDIFASRWAMDNLVFTVPEPGTADLLLLGLLTLGWRAARERNS